MTDPILAAILPTEAERIALAQPIATLNPASKSFFQQFLAFNLKFELEWIQYASKFQIGADEALQQLTSQLQSALANVGGDVVSAFEKAGADLEAAGKAIFGWL